MLITFWAKAIFQVQFPLVSQEGCVSGTVNAGDPSEELSNSTVVERNCTSESLRDTGAKNVHLPGKVGQYLIIRQVMEGRNVRFHHVCFCLICFFRSSLFSLICTLFSFMCTHLNFFPLWFCPYFYARLFVIHLICILFYSITVLLLILFSPLSFHIYGLATLSGPSVLELPLSLQLCIFPHFFCLVPVLTVALLIIFPLLFSCLF